ncbi:MAG TPA: pilus (MSHA type) biogenesis protein MshL [Gammaproteobacteria bacterium]|nr:pilus (MSHA type) biogenesis protein MshL [Gammaproteobacteria bacterium]
MTNSIRLRRLGSFIAGAMAASLAAGCATQHGVATQDAIDEAVREAIASRPEPVVVPPRPEPPPLPSSEVFDLDVMNADAREFFMSLVDGTDVNLVVHPDVTGSLSLTLKQVTLREVLETVRDVYGYDYRLSGNAYIVLPATAQTRVYEIDYLNLARAGVSRTRVSSGQVSQSSSSENRSGTSGNEPVASSGPRDNVQTMGSAIDTVSTADFWSDLGATLGQILGTGEGRQVVVNAQSGVVFARGMPDELRAVGDYLERIHKAARRQVVLEAKIIEVTLDDGFQAGVNWAAVQVNSDGDTFSGGQVSPSAGLDPTNPRGGNDVTVGPGNPVTEFMSRTLGSAFTLALDIGDFNAFVELLEMQGETRVLSSPRVATLNNQKAVIKAGTDEFFVTDISSNTVTGTASTTSRDVTLTPFFSGIALDVTPQISADGEVILHIHPTVSQVTDQTKELTVSGETDELPLAFSEIRESDSIVKARSGQIIAIGGLMRSSSRRVEATMPVIGRVPGLRRIFGSTREVEVKTELVILLRPIVVDEDEDWPEIIRPAAERIEALGDLRARRNREPQ